MGLEDTIRTGKDAVPNNWFILIYSYPGVGKTTLAAGAPKNLILEIDRNGERVLSKPQFSDVRWQPLRSFDKAAKFVKILDKDPLLRKIDTITVDTISQLQILERNSQISGDILLDKNWKFNEHIYTVNNFKTLAFVNFVLDMGKNVILLCHMKEEKDGEKVLIRPDLSPSLLGTVAAQMDGVFYLKQDADVRRLQLQGTPSIMTKSRFQKNRTIENPTFSQLLPTLEELKQAKAEEAQ